jgi:hypothetical protein
MFLEKRDKGTIKTLIRILFAFCVFVFSLMFTLWSLISNDQVQKLGARVASVFLSSEWKTEFRIDGFSLSPWDGLTIEKISVKDRNGVYLLRAGELSVRPGIIRLKKQKINIGKIYISDGEFQLLTHKGDSTLNLQFIIDYFSSADTSVKPPSEPGKPWDLSVSSLVIRNFRFHFQDENSIPAPAGMDYANIDAREINLHITDVRFDKDTIRANIRELSARERSGFHVRNLSGEFHVSPAFLKANNLKIITDNSDLSLSFAFLYPSWSAYNDFLNAVTIKANISSSYFDLGDIGFFAPDIARMKDPFRIQGTVDGTVSNFRAKDFRVAYGTNTLFWGNIRSIGLPNVTETFVDLAVRTMTTNKQDIESFLLPGEGDSIVLPGIMANIGVISFSGNFTGYYNDFVSNALFKTNLGNIRTDLILKRTGDQAGLSYKGQLDVGGFNLGRLLDDTASLGITTFRGEINGKGLDKETADLEFSIHVDSSRLLDYNYHKLDLRGLFYGKRFQGFLDVNDPSLSMNFSGMVDLSDSIPAFDFTDEIHKAQLFDLGFLHRDSTEIFGTTIKANFRGNGLDNLDGYISFENTNYVEGEKSAHIKNLKLSNRFDERGAKSYHLVSDFIDADAYGRFNFKQVVPSLYNFVRKYLENFTLKNSGKLEALALNDQQLKLDVRLKNTSQLTSIFLPFLEIADNSSVKATYDEARGVLSLDAGSTMLTVAGVLIPNFHLSANSTTDEVSLKMGSDAVSLQQGSKTDSLEVRLDTFGLASYIRHDSILYAFSWKAGGRLSGFDGFVSFLHGPLTEIKITNMGVLVNDREWTIDTGNYVVIDTSSIDLRRVYFTGNDQYLKAEGRISAQKTDTLDLAFNKIDISNLDRLIGVKELDLNGILSGKVRLNSVYKDIRVLSDLRLDDFRFNKEPLGDALLNVNYIKSEDRFDVRCKIEYTGNVGKNIPLDLQGSLYAGRNPRLDMSADLKNLNLKMVQPFVSSFMSGLNGWVSGHVDVHGPPDRPALTGELNLKRTEFKITYLNVLYSLADVVKVDSNAFVFNKITIYDSLGNKGILNGRISHEYFRDLRLNMNIDFSNFSGFNNTYAQNPVFYGKARGTGNVSITGPLDNISIKVKAETGKNTLVAIPISLTESVEQNDFIQFVTVDTLQDKPVKRDQSPLNLNIALKANPDAQVEVFLPEQLGNLKVQGNGSFVMAMAPNHPFSITGTYSITKGNFVLQVRNLLRLPMTITEGSRMTWSGDPADANLSVNAVYRTKTTLSGLTTNPDDAQIRFPVEVIFRLGGKLQNPEMRFSMNLPNVEEQIKSVVYRSIDTTNVSEMNEQMLYLLVTNSFKPVISSTASTINAASTSASLVTNQINSWLSGISNNVNMGVSYRPGTSTTSQSWDVSMSTQLLDNRLLIDGTFGMNTYNTTNNAQPNQIVGDINIEYILTRNRRWRVHAFNRTNNVNILNNNSPYTQGVGLKYQRDFYTFGELFGGKKWAEKQAAKEKNKKK